MQKQIATFGALLVVIAILISAGYFYWQSTQLPAYLPPPQEPPGKGVVGSVATTTDAYDTTIIFTNDGFSPRNITIKQGQRVRFLNASNMTTWPASGVHPTHTLYPEKETTDCLGSSFDSCIDLRPGQFFDFTFYYIGNWPFHDHLHPEYSGTITVTPTQ